MEQIELNFSHQRVFLTGNSLLIASLILGIVMTLVLASTGSVFYSIALPAIILSSIVACIFFANPLLNLVVVIVGFMVMASNESGFQPLEIAYAGYLFIVLTVWAVRNVILGSTTILVDRTDWALSIFLILLPGSLILTFLFNGDFRIAASELISLSLLLIYFPVKHAIIHYKAGSKVILIAIIVMCVGVSLLNTFNYASDLSNAISLSHVAGARVVVNDGLLMIGATMSLILLVYARNPVSLLFSTFAMVMTFSGVIMTQSRGSWLAFLVGSIALVLIVPNRAKLKIFTTVSIVSISIILVGYVLIGPFLNVVIEGLIERFGSIYTSLTQDLSLINRFRESMTVFEKITLNPFIGYGPGVEYLFYDIVHQTTHDDSFVHNGYIGLWYKYGLWGLGLVVYFWYSSIKLGLRAFRSNYPDYWTRLAGLAGAVPLIALTISALTQNPFFLKNYLFVFALVAGLSAGAGQRTSLDVQKLRPL
ncbi:MAG: O-antigen ligase family protein [Bacteroidetes bacterium]|nr:O-antigen ligase family protein [Bacteroidota bacterium]